MPGGARPGFLADLAPRIETERLILRGWRIEDYEPLAEMMADPECGRYITSTSKPLDAVASWFNMVTLAGMWAVQGYGLFVMEEKATGRFVGRAGPFHPIGWPGFEVGWGLHPGGPRQGLRDGSRPRLDGLGAHDARGGRHRPRHRHRQRAITSRRQAARLDPGDRIEIFGRMSDVWVSRA